MNEQLTALAPDGDRTMDFSVDDPADPPSDERAAAKFVYPGGSQPLDGYTIKRGVGHGGFGEIYYAVSDAGKEVALKLIRRNLDIELRGIRHCLNLKHPHLLSLFDIRQDGKGDTWVVMEFVAGGCLADALVTQPKGLPLDRALAWFHGTAAGVAYLHDRGIVHRDLKPGNIFSDEGLVKVGDYGLAKFVSCSRRSGQTESVGTVHYMAPEVANGRYGKEIDIYALGIMLYEMLTGRVPFEGESIGEVLMKHLTAKPDVSMLAEPYRGVIARALEKDPAKRFGSVAEMAAALPTPTEVPPGMGRLPSAAAGAAAGQAHAADEGVIQAEAVNEGAVEEEPILKAVQDTWHSLQKAWDEANLATPVKVAILVVGLLILLANAGILIPLAIMLLVLYFGYRVIRALVLSGNEPKRAVGSPDAHQVPQPQRPVQAVPSKPAVARQYGPGYVRNQTKRRRRPKVHETAAEALVIKPLGERLAELVGSLLAGTLVVLASCLVIVLLAGFRDAAPSLEQYAWLVLTATAGTWAVLIPSKFWEGTRGEDTLRRFIMMVVGLGLGVVAFVAAAAFMVNLPYDPDFGQVPMFDLPATFYAADGSPRIMAFMACFGTLFLVLRWWRQADPMRKSRLSLWAIVFSGAVAALIAHLWQFPATWLAMVAGATSVSVQLAAPWISPRNRFRRFNV